MVNRVKGAVFLFDRSLMFLSNRGFVYQMKDMKAPIFFYIGDGRWGWTGNAIKKFCSDPTNKEFNHILSLLEKDEENTA